MRIKRILSILLVILPISFAETSWSQPESYPCDTQLPSLKKTKNEIMENGGIWGLFEHTKILRHESSKAIQLDSKIQQLIWLLNYLCKTVNGVPLNELANYLTKNLKEKSKSQFRKELIILGKSEAEIDLWFDFHDLSIKNEIRKLNINSIGHSIQKSVLIINQYNQLAQEIEQSPNREQVQRVDNLYLKIEQLQSSDSYLALALKETSQVPRWDLDESTGGS
ncbi:MAG: hypothetical protein OEZ51_09035 [Nitrospinota bacterium]|nr:hypothetical protein [Nitrospinota bacterium]